MPKYNRFARKMPEIPRVNYNQIAPNYHTRYSNSSHSGTAQALRTLVHDISPKMTLDVGCGTGRWLAELEELVPNIVGLDFSIGMLQQAQQNTDALLINGNALHLPFADISFDYVQCL